MEYPQVSFGTYRLGDNTYKSLNDALINGYRSIETASLYKCEHLIGKFIKENEITYCVHPDHQGKGIGTFMVSEFIKLYNTLTAFFIPENIESSRVFEKLGFQKQIFYSKTK